MVEQGRITIDDKPVTAGTRVHDGAVVRVDGRQVTKEEEEIFLAFYKPKGDRLHDSAGGKWRTDQECCRLY